MAIKINQAATSPHEEAAASIETEVAKTLTKTGTEAPLMEDIQSESEPVNFQGAPLHLIERMEVGMSFKMPVAPYTMLEFMVKRSVPFNSIEISPDTVFDQTKAWVEAKLNQLIEEQQQQQGE